jgi:uncharacterized radical SAM superfamily Fe-S cluster-containing enzyme
MEVRKTEVFCPTCQGRHPGVIERRGDAIVGSYSCNGDRREAELSSRADLYEAFTARSQLVRRPLSADAWPTRGILNLIEITDTCNFQCPVCYGGCGPKKQPHFLDVNQVVDRVRQAKAKGARGVSLTGGEPTEHPHLEEIIHRISKLVRVNMPTNGYRLGTEPGLARRLKRAGLNKISVQLDTFDAVAHEQIRGNTFIEQKKQALEQGQAAGLRLGIISTVTHLNAKDAPAIVEYGLTLAPALQTIGFQLASVAGRHTLRADNAVKLDRETLMEELVASAVVPAMHTSSFWPLPRFKPWGMRIHPDCGATAFVLTSGAKPLFPLDELVDLERFFDRLSTVDLPANFVTKNVVPMALSLLQARRSTELPSLVRHIGGFLSGKGRSGLVVIGVGGFLHDEFRDCSRVDCCSTTIGTDNGPISPCLHFQ